MAIIIFAIYLLLSIYIFATYLQRGNLCKFIFRPVHISLDYDFPGKEVMIHLVAINYILTLGLWGVFLIRDTIQANVFGGLTILRGKSIALEHGCKFRHSSLQLLAREPTNRSLMFLR